MSDNNADWILQPDRPELIEAWFKSRQADVHTLLVRARDKVLGGLQDDRTPEDLCSGVAQYRKQAFFVCALMKRLFHEGNGGWGGGDVDRLRAAAQRHIQDAEADVAEAGRLHQLVVGLTTDAIAALTDLEAPPKSA